MARTAAWRGCVTPLLLCALMSPCPAMARNGDGDAPRYSVAPASLDRALADFALQSGLQLFYSPSLVAGRTSPGVDGRLPARSALERLLSGTGLVAVPSRRDVFVIRARTGSHRVPARAEPPRTRPVPVAPHATVDLDNVVVTGSRLPRAARETAMPLTVISREQIESSGFTTLFDLLRNQPGITGHHVSETASESLSQALTSVFPTSVASAASLLSLGPRGTLYLIDGRRFPTYALPSASVGGVNDLATVPISLVERIEILRGGASAIYGADAIGGVVNIITRSDRTGAEASALYGMSERGDALNWRVSSRIGIDLKDHFLSVAADHLHQSHLPGASRDWHTLDHRRLGLPDGTEALGYASDAGRPLDFRCVLEGDPDAPACRLDRDRYKSLVPRIDADVVQAHWSRKAPGAASPYLDLRASRVVTRMQAAPMTLYTPYRASYIYHAFYDIGPVESRNRSTTLDMAAGVDRRIAGWDVNVELAHRSNLVRNRIAGVYDLDVLARVVAQDRYRYDGRANPAAVIDEIARSLWISARAEASTASVRATSEFETWNGRPWRIALGAEAGRNRLRYAYDPYLSSSSYSFPLDIAPIDVSAGRRAIFAETEIPLAPKLFVEAAARIDWIEDFGSRLSPRLGARWSVGEHLMLRANHARSFRAPTLHELHGYPSTASFGNTALVPDAAPFSPCATAFLSICFLQYRVATNPALEPERASSWNAGAVLSTDRGSISLDLFDIARRNEIAVSDPVNDPAQRTDAVARDASGLAEYLDIKYVNDGSSRVRGAYLDATWSLIGDPDPVGGHALRLRLSGAYTDRATVRRAGLEGTELAGYRFPRYSASGGLQWRADRWTLALHARYFASHRVYAAGEPCPEANLLAGRCRNKGLTLLSLDALYRSRDDRWSAGFGIDNLTDRQPTNYEIDRAGYNPAFDDPVGRSFQVRMTRRF